METPEIIFDDTDELLKDVIIRGLAIQEKIAAQIELKKIRLYEYNTQERDVNQ